MNLFLELLVAGSVAGAKVGIAALGFALIFYTTREMHFAFGAVSVAAAYPCYWVVTALGDGPGATMTDASTTRRPNAPLTRSCGSTTAAASEPILQVPAKCIPDLPY